MRERKFLVHYLDGAFDTTYASTNYVLLGKDLEEYSEELNPDVQTSKNILGENSIKVAGYEPQSSVEPYYYESEDDALSAKLMEIANTRATGNGCKTSMVDVLYAPNADGTDGAEVWAYREDVIVVPSSVGGDTTGVQIPFSIYKCGNRVKGTFDKKTKKFTAASAELVG